MPHVPATAERGAEPCFSSPHWHPAVSYLGPASSLALASKAAILLGTKEFDLSILLESPLRGMGPEKCLIPVPGAALVVVSGSPSFSGSASAGHSVPPA